MNAPVNHPPKGSKALRIIALFLLSQIVNAESVEEQSIQLDHIRAQIKDVETIMEEARLKTDRLQAELKENELFAGRIMLSVRNIESQLRTSTERLAVLNEEKLKHSALFAEQKRALGAQIRAAYIASHGDYIKLLLNQEEPAKVGRMLAYHDHQNRIRRQRIDSTNAEIARIVELENEIKRENGALLDLKQQQFERNKEILASRDERENILAKLNQEFEQRELELQSLRQQEREINRLLKKLMDGREPEDAIVFESMTPFAELEGQLDWPVGGALLARFGNNKPGSQLQWHGVVIDAAAGMQVHAISDGRVIFADWFRNLGLLIIIDHGNHYMSLYGYNQSLLKKVGDWVLPGEVIALAGDSGGQTRSGVYFEIRHHSNPVNPEKWCRN